MLLPQTPRSLWTDGLSLFQLLLHDSPHSLPPSFPYTNTHTHTEWYFYYFRWHYTQKHPLILTCPNLKPGLYLQIFIMRSCLLLSRGERIPTMWLHNRFMSLHHKHGKCAHTYYYLRLFRWAKPPCFFYPNCFPQEKETECITVLSGLTSQV